MSTREPIINQMKGKWHIDAILFLYAESALSAAIFWKLDNSYYVIWQCIFITLMGYIVETFKKYVDSDFYEFYMMSNKRALLIYSLGFFLIIID